MNFGITELIVILAIAIVLFGTTKLKSMGSDLGGALRGFRKALNEDDSNKDPQAQAKEAEPVETQKSQANDPDSKSQ